MWFGGVIRKIELFRVPKKGAEFMRIGGDKFIIKKKLLKTYNRGDERKSYDEYIRCRKGKIQHIQ